MWLKSTGFVANYRAANKDSRIQKIPVINPLQALLHPQTQKEKLSCMDCQSPIPTSQDSFLSVNRSED
jgi:hypothetical protein